MNRDEREAFERAVFEYLEGALDASAAEALLRAADASVDARALFADAEALWHALREDAARRARMLSVVDLKDSVFAAIAADALPADDPALERPAVEDFSTAARDLFIDPMEDDLAAAAEDLRQHSGEHRREVDAYAALIAELAAIARGVAGQLPSVDLRDAVLATIAGENAHPRETGRTTISFRRGSRHRVQPLPWPLMAAAAALLVFLGGWMLMPARQITAPGPAEVAVNPPDAEPLVQDAPAPEPPADLDPRGVRALAFTRMAVVMPEPVRTAPVIAATEPLDLSLIGLDGIYTIQQASLASPEARSALRALATVPVDKARRIADMASADLLTRQGAAAVLPPYEARTALLALRSGGEATPSLVFAQAEATRAAIETDPEKPAPEGVPSLEEILAELREIDPENALAYYWEAVSLLQAGDTGAALALLESAGALEAARAYSLESARATEAALEAAGMNPDTAGAAAALTAGMSQYDLLTSVGQDLLDEAVRYEALGDPVTAQLLFTAAQRFGEQIEAGGQMSWEQLAGLDLQRAAIQALESIFTNPDDLMSLTNDALSLVASMESMASFFTAFNNLFVAPFDPVYLSELSRAILEQGDQAFIAASETPVARPKSYR